MKRLAKRIVLLNQATGHVQATGHMNTISRARDGHQKGEGGIPDTPTRTSG